MATDIIRLDEHSARLLDGVADDVFDERIDPDSVLRYVASPDHLMVVAVSEGIVVGQTLAVIHRHPDKPTELYIDDLGVAPAFQRQGVATRLLSEIQRLGIERGCEEVWVATEPDNEVAGAFYRSLGLAERNVVIFEGRL